MADAHWLTKLTIAPSDILAIKIASIRLYVLCSRIFASASLVANINRGASIGLQIEGCH